ncbi:hypothetical protein KDA_64570 [Dictyobacter alpinus]|uniref:non-specific serine/threonine protein kinase n=1 Tax=Dictyobacter alpinus TaxID=2014873 RepID=A0A402BHX4_9CHLR|nr:WD40 repeat domain-containing serine/threonine protein kinase [Dictyobacter alpinus]GCE30973.1 hypothetical protein KDA_64570 [Dictyobacter alpinus]
MEQSILYCQKCGAANDLLAQQCFACKYDLHELLIDADEEILLQHRYRLLFQVGLGGFGAVYKAQDIQQQHKIVAIKKIMLRNLTMQETIEATDGFNREVSILSRLSHARLPRIYNHFTDQHNWYLVMDFIDGETLEAYLQRPEQPDATRLLTLTETLDIGIQLCSVLDYLHTHNPPIVFRDLKPGNIIRTPTGKLYLIDFGIARYFKPGQARDTLQFGSPGYAAPEQYGKAQTTTRADIYSLGAILHQLLTGIDPAENPFHFGPLRLYATTNLAALDQMLQKMVSIEVDQRPASIQVVQAELERLYAQHNPSSHQVRPPGTLSIAKPLATNTTTSSSTNGQQQMQRPAPARLLTRRHTIQRMLALGILIGGVGGVGGLVANQFHAPTHIPVKRFNILHTRKQQDQGGVNAVLYAPQGDYYASSNARGSVNIWNGQISDPVASMQVSPTSIMALSWSYDGKYLACVTKKEVYMMEVLRDTSKGDAIVKLLDPALVYSGQTQQSDTDTTTYTIAWAPKNYILAIVDTLQGTTHLLQFQPPTNQFIEIGHYTNTLINPKVKANNENHYLAWSPDGRQIVSITARNQIAFWNAQNTRIIHSWSPEVASTITMVAWQPGDVYQILVIMNNTFCFIDTNGNTKYSYTFSDSVTDLAYNSGFDGVFIALNNGDIYCWNPQLADPYLIKNGNDTLAALNSITLAPSTRSPVLTAALSDGNIITYTLG